MSRRPRHSSDKESIGDTSVVISDSENSVETDASIFIHDSQSDGLGISQPEIGPSESISRARRSSRVKTPPARRRTHRYRPQFWPARPPSGMDYSNDFQPHYAPQYPSYPPHQSYPRYNYPSAPRFHAPSYTVPYYNSYMPPTVAPYVHPYLQQGTGPSALNFDRSGSGPHMPSHGIIPYVNPPTHAPIPDPPSAPKDDQKLEEKFAKLEKLLTDQKAREEDHRLNERFSKLENLVIAQKAERAAEAARQAEITRRTAEEISKAAARVESVTAATQSISKFAGSGHENVSTKELVTFKDAMGRKFTFPFEQCKTWSGMECLIKSAFLNIDAIGRQVADGQYDLTGPNGEIILPSVWQTIIEPGWTIIMHLCPLPDSNVPPLLDFPSPPDPRWKSSVKTKKAKVPRLDDEVIVIEELSPKERYPEKEKPIEVDESPKPKRRVRSLSPNSSSDDYVFITRRHRISSKVISVLTLSRLRQKWRDVNRLHELVDSEESWRGYTTSEIEELEHSCLNWRRWNPFQRRLPELVDD